MTGDRNKTRVIVSQRLISPLSCCNNFNSKALEFRSSVVQSLSSSRLDADAAVKAAMGKKPTYEDTDNRKREFTGTTKPGVTEIAPGIRVEGNQAWEEGRGLVLYPSWKSKRSMDLDANFGWIKTEKDIDFQAAQKKRKEKPQLQFTKYQVSKKTGDVIPDSEVNIDMAYPHLGLSRAQRRKKNNYISNPKMEFKAGLPGRSLESRVPGGNLLARTAGRFGIMRDAANKFRCPPGTPAANQFTDHLGSNCFGVSAERAAKFIAEKISDLMKVNDDSISLSSGAKSTWRERLGLARPDVELPGRSPSFDLETGDRIPTTPAEIVDVPGRLRWFKNATVNAQRNLARSESVIQKLESRMVTGDFTPEQRAVNADRHALLQILSNRGIWDINIEGRLSESEVNELIASRLESIPEWSSLTDEEKLALFTADKKRFYETERAMLDSLLEQFVIRPEHMRTIGTVQFRQAALPGNSEADTLWDAGTKGAEIKSVIRINLAQIMENQESLIPNMSASERLVISAVGAKTDAEALASVADFLINTEYTARGMAGLIDGPRSFARHIMLHEIAHTIQGEAFLATIKQQIDAVGYVQVPVVKDGKFTGALKEVSDFKKLTGMDLSALVISSQDDINLTALEETMSKIENVAFLAGSYPGQYKNPEKMEVYALESTAELWGLREEGLIFGDDIDDALGFMDDAIGAKASEARAATDLEMLEKLEESYFSPYERGEDVLPIRKHLRSAIELDKKAIAIKREEREIAAHREEIKDLDQDGLAEKLADTIFEIEIRKDILSNLEKERIDTEKAGLPLESIDEEIERIKSPLRLLEKKKQIEIAKNRDFNSDGKSKSDKEITDMALEINRAKTPATEEMVKRRETEARIDSLRSEAESLDEKSLMKTIADYDLKASSLKPDSDEYITAVADREIFIQQHIANQRAAGDTRPERAIRNELKAEITKEITASRKAVDEAKRGKLKPQKMKSKEQIAQNAKKERAKLRRNITKQQFEAVKEIDDFNTAEITQMLEPEKQVVIGRAINKRNNRLKRLGLESDPSSVDEGSLDEQVENILIPAMEAIDASDITTPFEMEVFLDSSKLSRVKPGKEIDIDSFGQGKVLSRSMKPGKPEKGSKKKRVVVQVKEGDRGLFPLAKKGDDQQFVIPPGKLRVVGRDKDGSLIVEISSQKDTVDVLDDLSKSIGDGPGDAIWRQGAKKKIQLVADRHAVKRKDEVSGTKSDDAIKVTETSESVVSEVSTAGAEFGETSSEKFLTLSSSAELTTESLRTKRHEKYGEVIGKPGERSESLKSSIAALMDEDRNLAASVEEILDNESNEQIIERIETAAQKLHSGFDRRVRVRMNEDDIRELAEQRKIRAIRNTDSSVSSGMSRRTERLSLSSGEKKMSRKDTEEAFAKRVKERITTKLSRIPPPKLEEGLSPSEEEKAIRKHVDKWFDNLTDAELAELGAKRFYLPDGTPLLSKTTGRVIYQTENNEVAASLLSLGQTVEMPEHKRGESLMVKQAASQIKKALKELAKENPGQIVTADLCKFYVEGKNVFCSENLKVDRLEMPQVGGRAVNNESMALRLWGSGLATAETVEAHPAFENGKLTVGLKARLATLENGTMEAEELEKDIEVLQLIGTGYEGAGVEQIAITPEQQRVMDKYGVTITARELKRLGEKWNRTATARIEGKEPDPSDELTDIERKNFFDNIDYSMIEPDGVDAFTNFLKMLGVGIQEDRVTKPDELMASQRELDGPKVDNISENILQAVKKLTEIKDPAEKKKEIERLRREHGLFKKILISKEGYIVDGHHRIIGKIVTNGVLSEDIPGLDQDDLDILGLPVRQIDMGIIELLTVSRIYQDFLGIKPASLSATDDDSFKTAGVVGKKSKKIITDAEDMHGIDKIPKITQQEFDDEHEKLKTQLEEKTDEIYARGQFIQVDSVGLNNTKESKLYKEVQLKRQKEATARVDAGKARSPGLKENRDRSVREYGMKWKPEYSEVKSVEESKAWDGWDGVEVTEVDLSSDILPTESHLKGSSIDKVVSGQEPFREGYYPNLVIDVDGKMYISDGHNRVAMNRALGNQTIQARVIDLRKIEQPWGEQKPGKSNYGGYDLVEPDNPLPESGKYAEDVVDAADKQREKLKPVEKEITKTLIDLSNKHGAVMIGLAARFKSVKSLARKINDERGSRTAEEAAADMSDVIRYTMTYTPENYVSGAKSVIDELQSAGYRLTVKNYWKTGDPYQGINIAAVHPDGTRFELQFHTPQSAVEKEVIHKVYDEYRVETDPKKRWKLYDRMTRMAERIDIPVEPGIQDIGETRFQDFSLASGAQIDKPEAPVRQSGATKKITNSETVVDESTGRSVGKNRDKKESTKKDVAAEWFSSFKSFESPDFGKNKDEYGRMRKYYESVGLTKDVRDDLMPVSGYLVHKSDIQKKKNDVIKNRVGNVGPDAVFEVQDNDIVGDGLTSLGDVEIVLKPEVSKRTSYGRGSGIKNGHRPVRMDSTSRDDIAHAVSYSQNSNTNADSSDALVNLLASSIDGDFSRVSRSSKTKGNENFEAHILGGFDADEVDSINYPYSKLSKLSEKEDISDVVNDKSIAASLRDMGFTQAEIDYFYSVGGPGQINTESMAKLREYRMSKKVKNEYSRLGFSKVKIAHPQGLNIENPRTHSKASRGIEDIESLLKKEIATEIKKTVEELLKEMRKGQKPRVVSKVGSGI